ncbi:hypothetical protein BN128_3765 [Cronobacter sakazakii 696]|nr:hypothetical protein BN128_3765 [Cronobacter sakazakii 696]
MFSFHKSAQKIALIRLCLFSDLCAANNAHGLQMIKYYIISATFYFLMQ